MERGDQLLYAMLPRQVAQVLRGGQHPLDTCQVLFEGGGGGQLPPGTLVFRITYHDATYSMIDVRVQNVMII